MKKTTKRIFSVILTACMLLGAVSALTLPTFAEEAVAKDYATANDGDLLYTLNWNFNDGVAEQYIKDDTATIAVSSDGSKATFSGKDANKATAYGAKLKGFGLYNKVYTISWFTEATDISDRVGFQAFLDDARKGLVSQSTNQNQMNILTNGSIGHATLKVDRLVDTNNNNRQNFKMVIDGIDLIAYYYVETAADQYVLVYSDEINYASEDFCNYLVMVMYNWDTLTDSNSVSVGNVTVQKGICVENSQMDGELLYEVDLTGADGKFTNITKTPTYGDKNSTTENTESVYTVTKDKATISGTAYNKNSTTVSWNKYLKGELRDYPIIGHVYTVSFYLETADYSKTGPRAGIHLVNAGNAGTTSQQGYGISTQRGTNSKYTVSWLYGGNLKGGITSEEMNVTPDTNNNNRVSYKAVIDGVNMLISYYAVDNSGKDYFMYQNVLIVEDGRDYINIALRAYDDASLGAVSLGDVKIYRGEAIDADVVYKNNYDKATYGGLLYDVDLSKLINFEANTNVTSSSANEIKLNYSHSTNNGAAQMMGGYFPSANAFEYGTYTYEFFVSSDLRTGIHLVEIGSNTKTKTKIGFSYFNNSTSAVQFLYGNGWGGADKLETGVLQDLTNGTYNQTPDHDDSSKPNVKIEVNTVNKTITNYILQGEDFVATARINYGKLTQAVPVISFYAWTNATNAKFSDVNIYKGLTVSKQDNDKTFLINPIVDGEYILDTPISSADNATELKTYMPTKDFYTLSVCKLGDSVVESFGDIAEITNLIPGKNEIEITAEYVKNAIKDGEDVELRGIQTTDIDKDTNTLSVRFVGVLNTLELDSIGFKIKVVYKDASNNVIEGAELDKSTTVVYGAIMAAGMEITADELGANYIYTARIDSVPANTQVDFYVTPYSVNGEANPADTTRITFVNGVCDEDAPALTVPEVLG